MSTSFATEIIQNLNENQENIGRAADSNDDAAATEQTAGTSTDCLLFPTLRAVFGGLTGDVAFSSGDDAITTRDADAIDEFVKTHDEVWASVITSTGEVAGRVFSFDSKDEADEFAVANGKPTIAFERDGAVLNLFYATSPDLKLERRDSEVDSIPLPVGPWTIYEGSLEFVRGEMGAPSGPVNLGEASGYAMLNNAILIGEVSPVAQALELKLGFGKSRQDKRWPGKTMTYLGLMQGLSKHVVGGKDGTAFMQGTAIGNERRVPAIDALYVMGLDVDSGIYPESVLGKLTNLGLTAIVYTTHSHMKSETFLVENSYNQFCKKKRIDEDVTIETVRRYLVEERLWEQWVADTVQIGEVAQTAEGKGYWLSHDPMPKFRIVFPLNEPFVIAKQVMSQLDAIKLWKSKLIGLSKVLELPIDEACLDPSRLFYLPRHAEGMPFGVWITGGDALDFTAIPEGKVRGQAQKGTGDKWQDAGADMTREKKPHVVTADGFDLTVWAAKTKASENFDIATLFDQAARDKIRNDQSDTKKTIECPFDHFHSNVGNTEDQGCFVQSPTPEIGINTFVFSCSHNGCQGRDRLEFIAEAVNHGWITREDLESPDYHLGLTCEPPMSPEKALANLEEQIDALTLDTRDSGLDSLFAALGAIDISNARRDSLFEKICVNIGVTKGNEKVSLKSRLRPHIKAAASKRQREKTVSAFRQRSGGLPPIDVGGGFNQMLEATVAALAVKNKGRGAFLFDLDGQKVVIDHNAEQVQPINVDGMQAELRRVAEFVIMDDDKAKSVDCPRNVANDLHVYRGHATPKLERFTRTPAFSGDGKLVIEAGYHENAKVYYSPVPGFVVPDIPDNPDAAQIKQAVDFILNNVLCDFPFDDGEDPVTGEARGGASSKAHAFALLLLGFMRDLIPGPTPIHLITKPLPGTGASLLVEALTTIPLGSPVASKVETNEEEERKEMVAFLRKAGLYYWKDNLQHKLQGSVIATAATNKTFSGRILGQSEEVEFPVRCIFVASGNNVPLADEIARRCLVIRLDAKRDPKKGRTFKHPRLQQWIEANRPGLVVACLTIIQGWISRGMPRWKGEPLASYSAYSEIMGGILDVAGLGGAFLGNLDIAQEGANPERDAEVAFATVMWKEYEDTVWSAGGKMKGGGAFSNPPVNLIAQNEIGIKLYGHDDEAKVNSLSRWLAKRVGGVWTILDKDGETPIEVRLSRIRDAHTKQWTYFFEKMAVVHVRAASAESSSDDALMRCEVEWTGEVFYPLGRTLELLKSHCVHK